jgi:glycosyltransferase involved in cell wall biosynthesis
VKVLHVTPSLERAYGGPTRSLAGFVRAAGRAGIAASVAGPACAADDLVAFEDEAGDHEQFLFPAFGRAAAVSSPALWRWLGREARRFDVVHVHGLFNPVSSLAARLCRTAGVAFAVRPFGTLSRFTFRHRRTGMKELYFRFVDGPNLAAARAIHFTTDAEAEQARWRGIDFDGRSWVVPPPWMAPRRTGTVRDERPTVAFISRLHPVKDVEALLHAWVEVVFQVPDAQLVVAGSGAAAYTASLKALRDRLGIADSVDFTGFLAGAARERLLERAWAFALPSRHENFGVAVLDAMGAGLPVVITPDVQLAGFVLEHGLGAVVERDPAALAGALVGVLRDDALRARCALEAPARIASEFSDERIGSRLVSMYEAAAGRTNVRD